MCFTGLCYHVRSSSLCTLHSSSQDTPSSNVVRLVAKPKTTPQAVAVIFPLGALNHHSSNLNALKHSFKLNHLRGTDLYLFTFPSGATPGNPSVRIFLQPLKMLSRFRFVQILASPRSSLQRTSELFSVGCQATATVTVAVGACTSSIYTTVALH